MRARSSKRLPKLLNSLKGKCLTNIDRLSCVFDVCSVLLCNVLLHHAESSTWTLKCM